MPKVERKVEVKATIRRLDDDAGNLVGFRVAFAPPSHSEEEHFIEREVFSSRPVTLIAESDVISFEIRDADAVARGLHNAENARRKRDGKDSIEVEAAKAKAKADAEAKAEADAKAKAALPPATDAAETIQ
jgi:hypothetical protein